MPVPFYASSPAACPVGWTFHEAGRSSQCLPPPTGASEFPAIAATQKPTTAISPWRRLGRPSPLSIDSRPAVFGQRARPGDVLAAVISASEPLGGGIVNRAGLFNLPRVRSIGTRQRGFLQRLVDVTPPPISSRGYRLSGLGQEGTYLLEPDPQPSPDTPYFPGQGTVMGPPPPPAISTAIQMIRDGPVGGGVRSYVPGPGAPLYPQAPAPAKTSQAGLLGLDMKTIGIGIAVVAVGLLFLGRK